jgi:glycosyltransferase involved in cell wall biosynthesis
MKPMKDKPPLFTVFTPTYNRAATLHRPCESLRRQTLKDFEWLVIDDGSTDNTREMVKGWQQEADFPIRYVWQENAGKAAAWNRALGLARGEFFVCLDSDDECVPQALEKFREIWESIPGEERGRFSGVTAFCLDESGAPYGPDLPKSPLDCSHSEVTYRLKRFHETWQCYRTEVIRQFPFELIPGYRNYLPEGTVINRVAAAYIQRHVNQRLRIYHTKNSSSGEHLSSGIAARASLKHAPGYRVSHLSLMKYQMRWFPYAPKQFYKAAANYIRFSWMQGISMRAQLAELGSMRARALWLAALPAGFALRMNDWRFRRRERSAGENGQRPRVLYISYDGLMEPLGQSQVLPYLRGLADDFAITVLSFEKRQDWRDLERRRQVRLQLDSAGLEWIPLRYHKRPSVPATAFDVAHGVMRGLWSAVRDNLRIVHVRGYVPGVIGLALKKLTGVRLIFDMRGFWPDEKVDAGTWRHGSAVYRAAKWFEKTLLLRADIVVSLTRAGVDEMRKFPCLRGHEVRFEVIPTCTDLELFRPGSHRNGRDRCGFTLGYVGSVGTFYLFDEVLECFKELLKERPDGRLLVLNRGAHEIIQPRIRALGVPPESVELRAAEYRDVPGFIAQMDAGAFFIKPTFSKKSSAPTRLGEFLACGVPCLVNAGVGDMDAIVSSERVGVVMREFSPEARRGAVRELLALCAEEETSARCVDAARRHFSLEHGVAAYRKIYRGILVGKAGEPAASGPSVPEARLECERQYSHR